MWLPSSSIAQPAGSCFPLFAYSRIRPRLVADAAMSRTSGSPRVGIPYAIGPLLNAGSRPPHGAMIAGALLVK